MEENKMFDNPKFLENIFTITFNRQVEIRKKANEIEEILSKFNKHYSPPHVLPIPDEIDPSLPRIIFTSTHGHSQIVISQMSVSLNVRYSPDYQVNVDLRKKYLKDRIPALFDLINEIKEIKPYFCGLTTVVVLHSKEGDDDKIIDLLLKIFLRKEQFEAIKDLEIKFTKIVEDRFFSNILVKNFREYFKEGQPVFLADLPRLPFNKASTRGIQIVSDFNDRYSFNELPNYFSNPEIVDVIINNAFKEVDDIINIIQRGSSW